MCSLAGLAAAATPEAAVAVSVAVFAAFTALGVVVVALVAGVFGAVVLVADDLGTAVDALCFGSVKRLAAPLVGVALHFHTPLIYTQATPSGALRYGSVCHNTLPAASRILAWPAVFESDMLVVPLVIIKYAPGSMTCDGSTYL